MAQSSTRRPGARPRKKVARDTKRTAQNSRIPCRIVAGTRHDHVHDQVPGCGARGRIGRLRLRRLQHAQAVFRRIEGHRRRPRPPPRRLASWLAARALQGLGTSAMYLSLALLVHQFPTQGAGSRARHVGRDGLAPGVRARPGGRRRPGDRGGLALDLPGQRADIPAAPSSCCVRHRVTGDPDRRTDIPACSSASPCWPRSPRASSPRPAGLACPLPGALLAAGLITGWLFVRAERRYPRPLLPLALFRSRELTAPPASA